MRGSFVCVASGRAPLPQPFPLTLDIGPGRLVRGPVAELVATRGGYPQAGVDEVGGVAFGAEVEYLFGGDDAVGEVAGAPGSGEDPEGDGGAAVAAWDGFDFGVVVEVVVDFEPRHGCVFTFS